MTLDELMQQLAKLKGGYIYSGICSYQICFPLKSGQTLRFSSTDDDPKWEVDLYDETLPPGITGPAWKTG